MASTPSDDELAQIIWDFNTEIDLVEQADIILVLGSHDTRVAQRAAELYKNDIAPLILFSGGSGRLTEGVWDKPEAEIFSEIALHLGVKKEDMFLETGSTNTGENIEFSLQFLKQKNMFSKTFIVVQKPYMLRRAWATFKKYSSDTRLFVTAPQISFSDYPNEVISKNELISIIVGDLQRLNEYPKLGYQVNVPIPKKVWHAYEQLVQRGYTQHLVG